MSLMNNELLLIPLTVTLLTGILCPAMGTVLITHKRLLQVNLISHCVLPGVALAIAAGIDSAIGGVISGLLGAVLAEKLTNRKNNDYEPIMNTILAGSLGLGVLLIQQIGLIQDIEGILFGDPIQANLTELLRILIAFTAFISLMIWGYKKIVHVGLDADGAAASGINVTSLNLALGITTALVIVSAMSAVGVILVIALLSAPTILGLAEAPSLKIAMVKSSIYGLIISIIGWILAISFDIGPGPIIGLVCIASLFLRSKK